MNTNATEGGEALLTLLDKAAAEFSITLVYNAIVGSETAARPLLLNAARRSAGGVSVIGPCIFVPIAMLVSGQI